MLRDVDRKLLPWILCGLLASIAAVAIGVNAIHPASAIAPDSSGTALPVSHFSVSAPPPGASMQTRVVPLATAAAPSAADPAAGIAADPSASVLTLSGPRAQDRSSPPLPAGEVWECLTNGERVFSDAPCGAQAAIHEIRSINTMNTGAAIQVAQHPAWLPPPDAAYATAPAGQESSDDWNGVYGYPAAIGIAPHRRHDIVARPHGHRSSPVRRN